MCGVMGAAGVWCDACLTLKARGGVKPRVLFLLSRYPVGYFVYAQHNRALSGMVAVVDFVVMVCFSIILPFLKQVTDSAPFPPPSPPPPPLPSVSPRRGDDAKRLTMGQRPAFVAGGRGG